jgi:hypothetical protein
MSEMADRKKSLRYYLRVAEGQFRRLSMRAMDRFIEGRAPLPGQVEGDARIASVMVETEGRKLVEVGPAQLLRYRVLEDGLIDRSQLVDRTIAAMDSFGSAPLPPGASKDNIIRAASRFLNRTSTWELTGPDRAALEAVFRSELAENTKRATRSGRSRVRLYHLRFEFEAFTSARWVVGSFQALVSAASRKQLMLRAAIVAEEERARGNVPWEADVELVFASEFDAEAATAARFTTLGGHMRTGLHQGDYDSGLSWPGHGRRLDLPEDELLIVLRAQPRKKCKASASMRAIELENREKYWLIIVENLPEFPYEAKFYRNSESAARKLMNALNRRLRRPITKNPKVPSEFASNP